MSRTAILYIAQRCNQHCVFCLEQDGRWLPVPEPSRAGVARVLAELRARGAEHLTFMGGETLFRKDLADILREARQLGFTRVSVTTNGTVLSKSGFLARLVASGLDFIELSIHGHTAELANRIGGTRFTFQRQAAALAELDGLASLPTIFNIVACRENKDHLVSIARYIAESHPRIPARLKIKFVSLQGLAASAVCERGDALAYDEVDAVSVGDYLSARAIPFWYWNFPLCRLGPHAAHSHEMGVLAIDETYFDCDHRAGGGYSDSGHQLQDNVWPASACAACTLRAVCPGVQGPYWVFRGARGLAPRTEDAADYLALTMADRSGDASTTHRRLAELREAPRPDGSALPRPPDEPVLLAHPDVPRPVELMVAERQGQRAFALTARFALAYRRWGDEDPWLLPEVKALLAEAAATLGAMDAVGLTVDEARAALPPAVAANGWVLERGGTPHAHRATLDPAGPTRTA